jgi:hypothetical protein
MNTGSLRGDKHRRTTRARDGSIPIGRKNQCTIGCGCNLMIMRQDALPCTRSRRQVSQCCERTGHGACSFVPRCSHTRTQSSLQRQVRLQIGLYFTAAVIDAGQKCKRLKRVIVSPSAGLHGTSKLGEKVCARNVISYLEGMNRVGKKQPQDTPQ